MLPQKTHEKTVNGTGLNIQAKPFKLGPTPSLHTSGPLSTGPSLRYAPNDKDRDSDEYDLLCSSLLETHVSTDHELRTAPVFCRDAYLAAGGSTAFPQRGVLGVVLGAFEKSQASLDISEDPRFYVNTNSPFSALVCGVQGSGKSHTVSVLLENMLIPNYTRIGKLEKALSGLVLHLGEGGPHSQPCEAAWVGTSVSNSVTPPKVRVYVSPSSLTTMRAVYAKCGPNITVEPLLFKESELDARAFLSMMAIGSGDHVPLYMQIVLCILRELGEKYSYPAFKAALDSKKKTFNPAQLAGLQQRMALMESFLTKDKKAKNAPSRFAAGCLTVVDLSDPFIDPSSACGIFEVVIRLFVRAPVGTGKVLVVDEAHKYLTDKTAGLTEELLSLIRQQRHLAMRVIISTQEPTVVPDVLLGLCSITILHRFSSPAWWQHVAKHASVDADNSSAFDRVVRLQTGQAIVMAAAGLGMLRADANEGRTLQQFGRRCLLVKTRQRVTADGGASILVVDP